MIKQDDYSWNDMHKETAADAFATGSTDAICRALVAVALNEPDWRWAQDRCLDLLSHSDGDVRGLASTCLGHIARVHGTLEKDRVLSVLIPLREDDLIGGRVEDALDDIARFT